MICEEDPHSRASGGDALSGVCLLAVGNSWDWFLYLGTLLRCSAHELLL